MLQTLIRGASQRGGQGRLSIFIFHRVLPHPDPLFPGEVDVADFDRMMGWITRWFRVLPLDHAARALREGRLPPGSAAITFDDGYADNLHQAMPVLRKHGACATLFVATGFLDGGCMWNDRIIESIRRTRLDKLDLPGLAEGHLRVDDWPSRRNAIDRLIGHIKYLPPAERAQAVDLVVSAAKIELPRDLMLTGNELRQWHAGGQQVGAHTVNHPILASLDTASARQEVTQGRRELESLLDSPVTQFAYPNGRPGTDYLPEHVEMIRQLGFEAAVSTSWGVATPQSPAFELPRFTPWERTRLRFGARLLRNLLAA